MSTYIESHDNEESVIWGVDAFFINVRVCRFEELLKGAALYAVALFVAGNDTKHVGAGWRCNSCCLADHSTVDNLSVFLGQLVDA